MPVDGERPPLGPNAEILAFKALIAGRSKVMAQNATPKFVKRLDEVPTIDLPPLHPMQVAISLADRALVEQFTGLWPSPKTIDNWIQKNWRPLLRREILMAWSTTTDNLTPEINHFQYAIEIKCLTLKDQTSYLIPDG